MEITFVRHAESESNVSGRWQGQGNSNLSDDGRRQAAALGRRLAGARFDRVVCSDLTRCCDTAAALDVPVERDATWREVDVGSWEGLTRAEVAERFPDEVKRLWEGAMDVCIGGGESWEDLHRRVDAAFQVLCSRIAPGERALVVTHGGVIHGLLSGLLGLRERRPRPIGRIANTAVSTVRVHDDESVELVSYNDVSHLGPDHPWARERLEAGDTIVTLVALDGASVEGGAGATPEDARAGRLRGAPDLVEVEQLGSWYPPVEQLYASGDAAHRNAAAVLAARHGAALSDDPIDGSDMRAAVEQLSRRHGPARIAIVAAADDVSRLAREILGQRPRVSRPRHAAVAHVVAGPQGQSLADYNVVRRP